MRLFHIWHLRNLQGPTGDWEFSVNYKVPVDNQSLRSMLQGETRIELTQYPEIIAKVEVLVTEARGRTEGKGTIEEGDFRAGTVQHLQRLMRKPRQEGREHRLICVGDELGPGERVLGDFQREFELPELSSASQAAVYRLDSLALETSHRMFGERARELDQYPSGVIPPIRKVTTFVAYRRSHLETAKRLHSTMDGMGEGTIFDPFIDFHDVHLGDWSAQLLNRIAEVDVFVPLVSPDYAEPATFGLEEFERAKNVADKRGWEDFFAPVFVGNPGTEAGRWLRAFDGYDAERKEEISPDNRALKNWLGRVAEAGIRRGPDGA